MLILNENDSDSRMFNFQFESRFRVFIAMNMPSMVWFGVVFGVLMQTYEFLSLKFSCFVYSSTFRVYCVSSLVRPIIITSTFYGLINGFIMKNIINSFILYGKSGEIIS